MALVALVFFLLVQVPTPNPRSAFSGSPPVTRVISFRTDASPEEIQAAGAELLESYGAFAVARGGEGGLALLKRQGRSANPLQGRFTLPLLPGTSDGTAPGCADRRVPWRISGDGGGVAGPPRNPARIGGRIGTCDSRCVREWGLSLGSRANSLEPGAVPCGFAGRRIHRPGPSRTRLERGDGLGHSIQLHRQLSLLGRRPRWHGSGRRNRRYRPRLRRKLVPPICGFHRLRRYLQRDGCGSPQGRPLFEYGRRDGAAHVARRRRTA